jgi:hypothetical protein
VFNRYRDKLSVFVRFRAPLKGVDLVNLLAGKVNTTDVYNALNSVWWLAKSLMLDKVKY